MHFEVIVENPLIDHPDTIQLEGALENALFEKMPRLDNRIERDSRFLPFEATKGLTLLQNRPLGGFPI